MCFNFLRWSFLLNFRAPGGELYVGSEHVFEVQERYGGVYYHAEFSDAGAPPTSPAE